MAAGTPTSVGTGVSTTNNTTVTITVSGSPTLGALLRVSARFNTSQTIASCTITDSAGNTYTIRNTLNGNEIVGDCIIANSLSGGTITITGSTNATVKIAVAYYVTQINQSSSRFGGQAGAVPFFQGTARNIGGSTITPGSVGDYVEGLWSLDTTETSLSASAGYTVLPTWTGTGYYTSNGLSLEGVYQIVSAVNAKEPKATGGASPTAYGALSLWYKHLQPTPAAGSVTFTGSATVTKGGTSKAITPAAGSVQFTGSAAVVRLRSIAPAAGSVTFAGAAAIGRRRPVVPAAGAVTFTGSAAVGRRRPVTPDAGSVTFTGSAAVGRRRPVVPAAGAVTFTGSALVGRRRPLTAAGSVTFTGSAVIHRQGSAPVTPAGGVVLFTGTATLTRLAAVKPSTGVVVFTGSASMSDGHGDDGFWRFTRWGNWPRIGVDH